VIEEATWSDLIVRYICGGDLHPDHDTICTFRRTNRELFEKAFVKVLLMAQETAREVIEARYEEERRKKKADDGPIVYCAMAKSGHHVSVADLEKHPAAFPPPPGAPVKEQMAHRLNTPEGKALYKQRKQTVEPVFGIIKEVLGFRRFSMRGKEKAETEWSLVCLSYNLKKIFKLAGSCAPKYQTEVVKQHVLTFFAQLRKFFNINPVKMQVFFKYH
jgi:hypothetical protein